MLLDIVQRSPRGQWVVVDKPAGLLSIPGKGPDKQDCVIARVKSMFPEAEGPMMVHRLDMATSGLLVVALDRPTQRALSIQFQERQVDKRYDAVLRGHLEGEGEVRLRMRLDPDDRPRQVVDPELGKDSLTYWRALTHGELSGEQYTVVSFRPHTGRTHQLRVHAAAKRAQGGLEAPIFGDRLYGDGRGPRLLLHASALSFDDPSTQDRVELEHPAPFLTPSSALNVSAEQYDTGNT